MTFYGMLDIELEAADKDHAANILQNLAITVSKYFNVVAVYPDMVCTEQHIVGSR